MEKENKDIPIELIESLIKNQRHLNKLIREKSDYYKGIHKKNLIVAINDYFKYSISRKNDLTKNNFDVVNYLNIYYGKGISYDFDWYMNTTKKMISIDDSRRILNSDKLLEEYRDKPNSEEVREVRDMFEYFSKHNIIISKKERENYFYLIDKMLVRYSHLDRVKGERIINHVDMKTDDEIRKLDLSEDPFVRARQIYLKLGEITSYSPEYIVRKKYNDTDRKRNIYSLNIDDDKNYNSDKKETVCKGWAESYASLLRGYGVDAKVTGDYHKYVVFETDGKLIKADATNVTEVNGEKKYIDLMRIQLGAETGGFTSYDDRNISDKVKDADKVIGYPNKSIDEIKQKMLDEYDDIVNSTNMFATAKIDVLKHLLSKTKLGGFQYARFSKEICEELIGDSCVQSEYMFRYNKGNYDAYNLIVIEEENHLKYFLLSEQEKIELSEDDLKFGVDSHNLEFISDKVKLKATKDNNEYTNENTEELKII